MKKILHIVSDEKFIDVAIRSFNDISCDNAFYCVVQSIPHIFHYIKNTDKVIPILSEQFESIICESDANAVCFHSLPPDWYELVLQVPKDKKIIWSIWGYDIYDKMGLYPAVYPIDLYKPITKSALFPLGDRRFNYLNWLKNIFRWILFPNRQIAKCKHKYKLKKAKENAQELQNKVLERIDYLATVLKIEYDLLLQNPHIHAKYFPYNYMIGDPKIFNLDDNASCILLGNSGDPSNNHYDIIDVLERRNISNFRYVPLSYSSFEYGEKLKNALKDNAKYGILDTFMPISEYKKILLQCKVAIFGHIRQQAMGNVLSCLRQGSKVFFFKDSMVYKYLKNQGIKVFTIEDDLTQENIDTPLTIEEIKCNQKVYLNVRTYDEMISKINNVLKEID